METNLHLNLSTMLRTWITWYYYISPGVFVKREFKKDLRGLKLDLVIGTGKSSSFWKLKNNLLAMLVSIEAWKCWKCHGLESNILFLWSASYIMGIQSACHQAPAGSRDMPGSRDWTRMPIPGFFGICLDSSYQTNNDLLFFFNKFCSKNPRMKMLGWSPPEKSRDPIIPGMKIIG